MSEETIGGGSWSVPKTRLFISYSHEDTAYRNQIVAHLAGLVRGGIISSWEDRRITPGQDWSEAIDENLAQADIIVVLASADFLASDYCSGIELQQALTRHSSGRSVLVPVIVRPCALSASPLAKIEALPEKARPVSEWENRDRAWTNVVEGILRVVRLIEARKGVFLEKFVPPILIKAYARRAHLVDLELDVEFRPDGRYVHSRTEPVKSETIIRNVQRLSLREPEICQRLEAFYKRLGESLDRAQKEVWHLYDTLFMGRGPQGFWVNLTLQEPLEKLLELLTQECEIYYQLSEVKLEGSLFGLPSVTGTMAELQAVMKAQMDNVSELCKGTEQLSDLVKELNKIGKRNASEEFEEPE